MTAPRLRVLTKVETRRQELGKGSRCRGAHLDAGAHMAEMASVVPERDFPQAPPDDTWIVQALDGAARCETLNLARLQLTGFLAVAKVRGVQVSWSLKSFPSIRARIAAYAAGVASLDLWDSIRCRITVPSLPQALDLCQVLTGWADVVRLRNYYRRPRLGPDDPYRAVHACIRTSRGSFYELQVMTVWRDAVCEIDHPLVHKKSLTFESAEHRSWLGEASWTANILDVELSRG
jgi:hypothetical protein